MQQIVEKFQSTGSVEDAPHSGHLRSLEVAQQVSAGKVIQQVSVTLTEENKNNPHAVCPSGHLSIANGAPLHLGDLAN